MILVHVGVAVALIAWAAAPARAQSVTGTIEGIVVDQSGGVLPGVRIAIRHVAAGPERTVVTDRRGGFRSPLLPVGIYQLTPALSGFEAPPLDLNLTVGQTAAVRIEMAVAGQRITVAAAAPLVETSRSKVSATIDEVAVRNLPVNGRNFLDFALLTSGVTRDVRGGDLSFAGQRGTLNSVVVDGVDNNNTFFGQALGRGRAPYQFSQDAVEEFQVNSSSYSAEYGRAGAGIISVVTRSGTNGLRGSLFEFYRDKALNATNAIDKLNGQPKSPYHYHQFGGTLGGPLRRDRDFYFLNYDGQRNRHSNVVFLNLPPDTPSDSDTQRGIELLQPLAYSWDRSLNQDVFLAKTDHQLRTTDRVTVRYNHQDFTGDGYENGGSQQAFEHTGASIVKTRTLNANWAGVFGSRMFNELRLQYARDHEPGEANSENPEADVRQGATGVLVIGRNTFSPRSTTIDRVQVADTLTAISGAHKLKAGFDLQLDRIDNYFPGFFSGQYIFTSLASFARGRPDGPGERYQQSFAGPGTSGPVATPNLSELSLFLQDDWRVRSGLTLNFGLRYDVARMDPPPATNPDPQLAAAGIDTGRFDTDLNNLAPRVGIAWSLGRSFVARAGGGVHYGRIPAILVAATGNNGINVLSVTYTGADVPTYPAKFDEPPAVVPAKPNIFYIDRHFASSKVTQASGAVEWSLGGNTSLAATYLLAAGSSLARSVDRNLGPLGERALTVFGTGETLRYHFFGAGADRPFQKFGRVIGFESNAESEYHGLTFDLHRRFAGDSMFRVAYTLGRVIDTVPDATAVAAGTNADDAKYASNPADFEVDRTVGNNDQRHRLVASGVYGTNTIASGLDGIARGLAGGWWFSGILTAQTGRPYSARVNADLNGDGNTRNDLAPGTRRNALRLPAVVQLDLRVARDIPLGGRAKAQLIAEAFNLFNRANFNGVMPFQYSVAGTVLTPNPNFGKANASAGERIVQLAVRITF